MTNRRVTFADIAAAAGVSTATVSLVLHESPLVAATTRARVEDQLRKQGYVYNRAAAGLRRRRSSSIALVINDLSNPFFAEFAAGVDEALAGAGFITLLGSTGESTERQQKVLGSLMEHDPAGIILSPAEGSDGQRLLDAIGAQTPTLVFNRDLPRSQDVVPDWDFLALDNRHGARLATEHLLQLGHRRVAFFGGHAASSSCGERRKGFYEAMEAAGIGVEPRWLIECAPTRLEAAMQTGALFACDPTPTAAVCYNDAVALGLMLGLTARGRRPGIDFAVTGFDDIPETAVSTPPLSTVATAPRRCGRHAAERLLARIHDTTLPASRLVAPVEMVARGSTCPASGFKVQRFHREQKA